MTGESEGCGAEHPEQPGVVCTRDPCSVYHRSGAIIWTQGAQPMQRRSLDPVTASGILQRSQAKQRRLDQSSSEE